MATIEQLQREFDELSALHKEAKDIKSAAIALEYNLDTKKYKVLNKLGEMKKYCNYSKYTVADMIASLSIQTYNNGHLHYMPVELFTYDTLTTIIDKDTHLVKLIPYNDKFISQILERLTPEQVAELLPAINKIMHSVDVSILVEQLIRRDIPLDVLFTRPSNGYHKLCINVVVATEVRAKYPDANLNSVFNVNF